MTRSLAAVVVALVASLSASPRGDSLDALRAQFGTAIESLATSGPEVRYCPDNTCEAFRAARGASGADVADFALLYLWGVSQYTYLEAWHKGVPPAALQTVVQRHGEACAVGTEGKRVGCVLRKLAKVARIRAYAVRYDEGAQVEEQLELERELRRLK